MQQQHILANEREKNTARSAQAGSPQKKQRGTQRASPQNFVHWDQAIQLKTFLTWLPKELHDAPGIDWTKLSPGIMGFCVNGVGQSSDAAALAMAAASMAGAISVTSQQTHLKQVASLFRSLRSTSNMQCLTDLKQEQIWHTWAARQKKTTGASLLLSGYASVAMNHYPHYLLRLDLADRPRMQQYAFPPLPVDLKEKYFPKKQIEAAQQTRRKAQTDILVPLYPVLRQLIRFRKHLTERTVLAIREAQRKVEAGEAELPFRFQHTDVIPEVSRDARTIADVQIQGREVTMQFVLWNKSTWLERHPDRYSDESIRRAEMGKGAYMQDQNSFFVQFDGPACDLLWIGDLVEHRLFQRFEKGSLHVEGFQERWQLAQQLGFSKGCFCSRAEVLNPGDRWFFEAAERGDELIFEFESLYRAVLFGTALVMLALSNGSRMTELLQVSWNKERRITRTETVTLLGEKGQSQLGQDGKPMTEQVKLHFQHLLPKGAKTEEERQLFPLSKEAMRLLGEIKELLEKAYGEIPIVSPSRSNTKHEQLKPERYLFQWDASSDGQVGVLSAGDVQVLLRFMLHGLDLFTSQGKPIRVSVHILRHVMATHARHHRNVPPEAIAYFFLHHRLKELTGHAPSLSEISEYYTLMTEEQRLAAISADMDEQEELDHALLKAAPTPRDLEQMNEDLRIIFELWHSLHPTALGYCGCPGLCPRGNDRALCLGCSYLVTDPERIGAAISWRDSYVEQAKMLEAQGNFIDARQARIKIQFLDDIINVMRLQVLAEADGSYIPFHKVLPSLYLKQGEQHETED